MVTNHPVRSFLENNRGSSSDIKVSNLNNRELPSAFASDGFGFVLLHAGEKFPPIEKAWQEKPHSHEEAVRWLSKGGNVGVLIRYPFGGLDQDSPDAFRGLDLPETTGWETRPGRTAYLVRWSESESEIAQILQGIGKKPDIAQIKLFRNGAHVGEIKLQRTYQVIPPSWKTVDGVRIDYRMIQDVPPATVSFRWLIQELRKLGISFSEKARLEENVRRLEENVRRLEEIRTEPRWRTRDATAKAEEFLQRAIRTAEEHYRTAKDNKKEGIRNDRGFWLAQQLRDLGIDPGTASEYMIRYQRAVRDLGDHEYTPDESMRSLESAYSSQPREPPRRMQDEDGAEEQDPDGLSPEERARIHEKALEILRNGDPIQYIVDSCARFIVGGEKSIRKQICCISVQNVRQSQGLHRGAYGESGSGKTHSTITFTHHLPPEMVVLGSMSSLALYYHHIAPRSVVVIDDYAGGNETLDTIMKQTSSVFHQTYRHRTVIKQKPVTLEVGPEITWFVTSVDPNQDIQVLNRQLTDSVDDSMETTRKVNQRILERYGKGEEAYPLDEPVLVSREIFRILRSEPLIDVRIPFWERIDWLDNSNRRNLSLFLDVLIAHTAMYRYQRERDADGFYLASEEDFHAAVDLLFGDSRDAEEMLKRLSKKELELLQFIKQNPRCTQGEMATRLGVSARRIRTLLYGENGRGGLNQKVGLVEESETISEDDRKVHRKTYRIVYDEMFDAWSSVVRLKPASEGQEDGEDGERTVKRTVKRTDETITVEREDSIDRDIDIDPSSRPPCGYSSEHPKKSQFSSETVLSPSSGSADSDSGVLSTVLSGVLDRPHDVLDRPQASSGVLRTSSHEVDHPLISELLRRGELSEEDVQVFEALQQAGDHGAPAYELAQKLNRLPSEIVASLKKLAAYGLVRNRGRDPKEPHDGDHWLWCGAGSGLTSQSGRPFRRSC